jgi:hypothetical protein
VSLLPGGGEIFGVPGRAIGPCGLMDKALVFGTKDCGFESRRGCFRSGAPHTAGQLLDSEWRAIREVFRKCLGSV